MKIKEIQEALSKAGYPTGAIDGIWGRKTIAAVKMFQASKGLVVDGIAGPQTLAALQNVHGAAAAYGDIHPPLVWFEEAKNVLGLREGPGAIDNPRIIEWADDLGLDKIYKSDDIPWCGLFVGHCIGSTLPDEPLPANLLRARDWERFGAGTKPKRGAVMVFWRNSLASGKGHVGFYVGEDTNTYCILGGNQGDEVSLAWISKSRFITSRWPSTVAQNNDGPVELARNGAPVSVREA